jgi:hypothetical protein
MTADKPEGDVALLVDYAEHAPECVLHCVDHEPDADCDCGLEQAIDAYESQATRIATLEAALRPLAAIPLEDFGLEEKPDERQIMAWNGVPLKVGHVKAARRALSAGQE